MSVQAIVLGCGNSSGVPAIGNYWGQCDPENPKNKRGRSSLAVVSEETTIVIDTGPDFREQFNRENLKTADYIFYTHAHSDHCHGIDDLRSFYFRGHQEPLDVFMGVETAEEIEGRFPYLFKGGSNKFFYPPILKANILKPNNLGVEHRAGDITFIPFSIDHGTCVCMGYRFGDFGYAVDMKSLDEAAVKTLQGVKTLIVDAAGYKSSQNPVHASIEEVIDINAKIRAKMVYLTSLTTQMDYGSLLKDLPDGYAPAYDGLRIDIGL